MVNSRTMESEEQDQLLRHKNISIFVHIRTDGHTDGQINGETGCFQNTPENIFFSSTWYRDILIFSYW